MVYLDKWVDDGFPCHFIPDSRVPDSGFRIPDVKNPSELLESGIRHPGIRHPGIRIPESRIWNQNLESGIGNRVFKPYVNQLTKRITTIT